MTQDNKPRCNAIVAQQSSIFSPPMRWPRATMPRREQVLSVIEKSVDWSALEEIVRPIYTADVQKVGRRGHSLRMMLRVFALQAFWSMTDRQTERTLMDSHGMARFCGLDAWQPRPPSAAAIRGFRKLLTDHEVDICLSMADHLSATITANLRAAGLEFRPGTVTDPIFRQTTPPTPEQPQ